LSVAFGVGIGLLYEGLTNPLPARVAAGGGWLRGLEQFLVRAGLRDVTARDFLLFSLGSGAVGGLAAQLFLGWGVVTLLAVGLGLAAPFLYYVRRHDRRRAAVQGALADAIAQLRDSIRTGLSVQDALTGLARNGPVALRPEFATLVREMRLLGFEPALAALRHRLADPVVDMVVAALVLNDRLGGRNVSQVLDRLAHATRAQLQIRGDVRAQQARNVLSARVVAAMPLVVLIAVRRVNPGYLALFDSWWGQALLAGCLVSITVGYVTMLLLTRLPEDDRLVGA
jgi:tight adherence protein B